MAIGRPIEQTPNIADKVVTATATAGQTQFTVDGGYRINHLAVFRNGVRLVNGNDYTALDGTTITLMEDASNLDVLEFQVFDTFNVSDALLTNAASQTVNGDVTVTGTFTVGTGGIGTFVAAEVNVGIVSSNTGITTVQSLQASSSTTTGALQVKGGVGIGKSLYVGGNVSVGGTLTYEDVTNVDSVGVVTAGKGVRITTGGLVVTAGVSTFAGITTVTNTAALHSKQLNVSAGSTFGGAITASDTLTVAGNVDIADKIIHTGDTNTTIRFPSADTITAETGGSERIRIDSDGFLGVSNTSPGSSWSNARDLVVGNGSGNRGLSILSGTSSLSSIEFSDGTGSDAAKTAGGIRYDHNGNYMRFNTNDGSEALRIDSSGRLLLGTTTEGEATADNLTIADSGHCGITLRSGTSSVGTLFFSDSTSGTGEYEGYVQYDHGSNFLKFATNASEKIRVGWGGTVSISQSDHAGAQTLGADLVVADTTGASIIVGDTGSGEYLYLAGDGGIGKVGMKSNHDLAFFTNGITGGSERLRITAGGYVGIGTQIPDKTGIQNGVKVLEVSGGDGGELIVGNHASHNVSAGMHVGSLAFKNIDSSTGSVPHYAGIRCKTSDTVGNMDLRFYTGINNLETDTPQVLINSTGLVGINTSVPTALLSFGVKRSTQTMPPICFQADYGPSLADAAISTTDDSGGVDIMMGSNVYMGQNGTFTRYFSSYGSAAVRCQYTGNTLFYNKSGNNAPEESMRINGDKRLLIGGTTSTTVWGYGQGSLQVIGDYQGGSASFINNEANTNSNAITLAKTRNGGIVSDNDTCGALTFSADDGNGYSPCARVMGQVDGTPGDGDMPGRLVFETTADGSSSLVERMRIRQSGQIVFNKSDGAYLELTRSSTNTSGICGKITFGNTDWDSSMASIQSYQDGANDNATLRFYTQPTGGAETERLRIASDGEVFIGDGIGTADRNTVLSVSGSNQDPGGVWTTMGIYSSDSYAQNKGGSLGFGGQDGSTTKQQFAAISGVKENGTSGNYAGALRFWTRPAGGVSLERMKILSTGTVQIMSELLSIGASTNTGGASSGIFGIEYAGNAKNAMKMRNTYSGNGNAMVMITGSTEVGSIVQNTSSTAYNTSSDYRLKENQVAISDGITRLKTLKPYRFNWKVDPDTTVDGFFAHEVTAVPEAIKGTKDAVASEDIDSLNIKKDDPIYQQIDQSKLVPLLTAALQEAITKIETLETKVAALESA